MGLRRIGVIFALSGALLTGALGSGHATATSSQASTSEPEIAEMVAAYLRDYPGIGADVALRAATGQGERATLVERLATSPGFGGARYDPIANRLHIYAVDSAFESGVLKMAAGLNTDLAFEKATSSYRDLEALAGQINATVSDDATRRSAIVAVADGSNNRVAVVVMDPGLLASAKSQYATDARIVVRDFSQVHPDPTTCVSRTACGTPARSGTVIGIDADGSGSGSATQLCSLGFTAAATDGSKWIVTAGHCADGFTATGCPSSNACWGAGQQYFGPMRSIGFSGNLDVGRIRKDNAYWATGGYIYNATAPNSPLKVNYSILARSTIVVGDVVCQAVWHAITGSECGTVVNVASYQGLVETSIDSCYGDSGGGWYALIGSQRWAYGIQSRADNGGICHGAGDHSYFSAIPDINAYWDSTSGATIRVEVLP